MACWLNTMALLHGPQPKKLLVLIRHLYFASVKGVIDENEQIVPTSQPSSDEV